MKMFFRLFLMAKHLWPYYVAVIIGSIIVSLLAISTPFITKIATDYLVSVVGTSNVNIWEPIGLALLFFAAQMAYSVFENTTAYVGDIMTAKLHKVLSERYYEQLLRLPQQYFDNELGGTIINRLNRTINDITQFIKMFANTFIGMIMTTIVILVSAALYSWELALIFVLIYPTYIWLTALSGKRWGKLQNQKNKHLDLATGRFAEVVSQIRVVKSFLKEKAELVHFQKHFSKNIDISRKQSLHWHKWDFARKFALALLYSLGLGTIFIRTANGQLSIGEMVFLLQIMAMMRGPLFGMSFFVESTQRAITGSKDYFTVMSITPDEALYTPQKRISPVEGAITYDNVAFTYDNEKCVLKGINFTVEKGQKVAFVGESGEGKTTITNLLMRLYEPTSGAIRIDGKDIADITMRKLRQSIGVVFQEPALFSGTVRENIGYANPRATDDEIIQAAKAANAHDFIEKLEHGYHTKIGERGLKLSGGQKQRIAIARAILKDSPILILDEATSSLDSKSERLVQAALERLMKGRTTLIIAHRLSTIADVDKIITLKSGKVNEIGSPDELAKTDGIYARLLAYQNGNDRKDKKALAAYEIKT